MKKEEIIAKINSAILHNRAMRNTYNLTCFNDLTKKNDSVLEEALEVIKTSEKEYERGMNDIWEAMRKLIKHESEGGYSIEDTLKIVGHHNRSAESVINRLSPEEVLNRIAEFDKKKEEEAAKPKLGDVVEVVDINRIGQKSTTKGIYIKETDETHNIIVNGGNVYLFDKDSVVSIKKTGEHVDIQGMLDKIG